MITKFKQFFTRTLGITLTTVLIASGLTALAPTAAYADEINSNHPTTVTLKTVNITSTTTDITATVDVPLEESSTIASLYKVGTPTTIDTASTGSTFSFTVPNPATSYEQYYVVVGNITSNTVAVNANVANGWSLNLKTLNDVTSFKTQDTTPKLVWTANKSVNTSSNGIYLADKTTGAVIYKASTSSTTGEFSIPRFYTEDKKEYIAYIATYSSSITNVSQLTSIQTVSNSLFINRASWTVTLTTNLPTFSTDDGSLYINWALNQSVGSTGNNFRFYLTEESTGNIITTTTSTSLTGYINISKFNDVTSKNYIGYLATATSSPLTNVSQLTNIQATSNVLTISRAAWSLSLSTDTPIYDESQGNVIVEWASNQSVVGGNNNYNIYIADKATGQILYRYSGFPRTTSDSSFPGLAANQSSKEFVGYIAWQGSSTPTNVSQLTRIQAVSNVLKIQRDQWGIEIYTETPVFTTTDAIPEINWITNRPVGSGLEVYVIDDTTGEVIGSGGQTEDTGNAAIAPFKTGEPHTYTAYIASVGSPDTFSQLTNIQATSNTISIARASWDTTISIDREIFKTDDERPNFTWHTNQKIGSPGSEYELYIVDETTEKIIGKSTGYGVDSTGADGEMRMPKFYTGGTHQYRGYVAKATGFSGDITEKSELEDIQAISNTVTATRYVWEISLGIDKTIFTTNVSTPKTSWATNQSVRDSKGAYSVYIFNAETGELESSTIGKYPVRSASAEVERFYTGGPRTYIAYVAATDSTVTEIDDLEDIQATSNTVSTQRAAWGVGLEYEITEVDKYNETKRVQFKWLTNQPVDQTDENYRFYLFNKTTGDLVESSYPWGTADIITEKFDLNSQATYIAYIAKYDSNLTSIPQLEDIQATSNAVFPEETSVTIEPAEYRGGGNPSKADCNQQCYGDPVNSYNGEFFENTTDLTITDLLPFNFTRSYSIYNRNELGSLGNGWTHNYEMKLEGDGSSLATSDFIKVFQENSSSVSFAKVTVDGVTTYVGSNNVIATFRYDETTNEYILNRNVGYEYVFNANGVFTQMRDLNGNTLTLNYTLGKLTSIVSSQGKTLTINWVGNKIVSINDGTRTVTYEYTPANNLSIVDLPDTIGHKQYIYDTENRITKLIQQNGGGYQNEYNNDNQVIKQTNPLNGETTFSYGTSVWDDSRITTITMPDGTVNKEEYNIRGQLSKKTLAANTPEEAVYEYEYDFSGQVSKEIDPIGNETIYTHDNKGNISSVKNALNNTAYFTYNDLNKLIEVTNSLGDKALNEYDNKGNLIKSTSFEGNVTQYEVNPNGTNQHIKSPNDYVNNVNKKVSFGYDSNGFLNTTTNPEGGTLSITNDILGNPLTVTDPLNNVTSYTYNNQNQLVETLAPNGAITEAEYDNTGQVTKTIDELGNETVTTYDLMGNVLTTTTPLGTVTYEYDNMQRVIKITNINGGETEYEYDKLGRVTTTIDALNNETHTTYTEHSLVASTTDSLGNTTTYEYDVVGNTKKITDALDKESTATYDELNRLISTSSASGYTETYVYDDDNNLISTTKAGTETTAYEYDNNGNLVKTIYPDSSTELRTYTSDNELLTITNRDGQLTSYQYNAGGQVTKTIRPDSSEIVYAYTNMGELDKISYDNWATIDTEFIYNTAGQLTSEFKNGVETTYAYDAIGNLTKRGPPVGDSVEYDYNSYGQIVETKYPSGLNLNYTYDLNSNLKQVKDGSDVLAEYIYDANGNNTRVNYGNNTYESNSYDELNRLEEFTVNNSNNQLYKKELELNNVGLIVGNKTTTNNNVTEDKTYTYNANQRLENVTDSVSSQNNTYSYDTSHNLLSSQLGTNTFTANGKLTGGQKADTSLSYTHDSRGNRTERTVTDNASSLVKETVNYSWTADNKLSNFTLTNTNNTSLNRDIDYRYDTNGLLVEKDNNLLSSSKGFTWDTISGIPTLLEDSDNSYIYGVDSTPFAQIDKSNDEITYLHGDERGSVILATDNSGMKEWSRSYDEYGSTFTQTPSTGAVTAFAYAGEYLDEDTNLYNLRARWYEPETASFISVDPALSSTGEAYSYASGNPLKFTDPLGLASASNWWNAGAGFLDGLTGIPIASSISNLIAPGSVQTCSPEYMVANIAGNIAGLFINPGIAAIKIVTTTLVIAGAATYGAVKLIKSIPKLIKAIQYKPNYVYRGVHPRNSAWENAQNGIVKPKGTILDPEGHHNGLPRISGYTSWTKDPKIAARKFATDKGIVLRIDLNKISPDRIHKSPDTLGEKEILITGEIQAEIWKRKNWNKYLKNYYFEEK